MIDNFMVHELDGTKNEWGWCKQKVWFVSLSLNISPTRLIPKAISLISSEQMLFLLCPLQSVKLGQLSIRFLFTRLWAYAYGAEEKISAIIVIK